MAAGSEDRIETAASGRPAGAAAGAETVEKRPITPDESLPHPGKLEDSISSNAQAGVQAVEATTIIWGKWHLVGAYAIIWFIYFITSTQEVVLRTFNPFITSSFSSHSLTPTTTVMSSIFGGLSKLMIAKILDTWGRPQGLTLTMFLWIIGIILMAVSNGVTMYAAAMVFSTVGAQGVSYCLTVFIADTSSLRNRGLMLSFATSPYIVTTWIGGPWADSILTNQSIGWRWGVGMFAIITPAVVLPLSALFYYKQRQATEMGLIPRCNYWKIRPGSIYRYCVDIDLIGILILAGGMALTLLAFNIYHLQTERWAAPLIIAFLVCGPILLAVFAIWEWRFAPVKFIPMHLLADRTVFMAGMMFLFVFFGAAVWNSWFISMLLVAFNQRVSTTTYISNIYRTGSCASGLVVGYFIHRTGRFKWVALYFALPLYMLGVGLMIHFRNPDAHIGYIVMTQIFVAIAGGPVVIAGEMAMMAPLDHQYVAVIIAILDLFGGLGTALGSTLATAIWGSVMPEALRRHLPEGTNVDRIVSSMYFQLGYPVGTPIRVGISWAYADAQRYMLIASLCLLAVAFVCVLFWRDIKVSDKKQTKGNVV